MRRQAAGVGELDQAAAEHGVPARRTQVDGRRGQRLGEETTLESHRGGVRRIHRKSVDASGNHSSGTEAATPPASMVTRTEVIRVNTEATRKDSRE